MRLSEWAKKNGVHYRTARRWFDEGAIPGAYRISERIVIVPDEDEREREAHGERVAIYARVSSHDQKDDLIRQSSRLQDYAVSNGMKVTKVVEEIASGMNPHRKKLLALLADDDIDTIVVEHRDRLARVNADLVIAASDKNIVVVNESEMQGNDIQDVIDFLTSVCAREHGRRSARRRAEQHAREMLSDPS